MTTLVIARHGNTFNPGETPRRVGARTDIPLTDSGREQARLLGLHLQSEGLVPDVTYSSNLKRTKETAKLALAAMSKDQLVTPLTIFDEIDYGPDENKTEEEVIARIGAEAIADWNEKAIVPAGWLANPEQIKQDWQNFSADILTNYPKSIALVVTSNGTARFSSIITGDFESFCANHTIKLSTGAFGILKHDGSQWKIAGWNIKPVSL